MLLMVGESGNLDREDENDSEGKQTLSSTGGAPEGNDYAVGNSGGGAPEGNGNAISHGATASPPNLYTHLSDDEREWIDDLATHYVGYAPFGPEHPLAERVTRYCTMIYQEWAAASVVESEGPSEKRPVDIGEGGEPVIRDEEHHLSKRELSLNSKIRQGLKDLGCLPDPDSEQADAVRSLAQVLSEDE